MPLELTYGGTRDNQVASDKMEAINAFMGHYYQTDNWMDARDQDKPGLKNSWRKPVTEEDSKENA